jgi:hypothetical protein
MAMNFVTFNQDYSYLAVGKTAWSVFTTGASLTPLVSYFQGVSHIHNRAFREELRDQRWEHRHNRDAFLNLAGGSYSITAPSPNH